MSTQAIIMNQDFALEFMAGNTTLEAVSDFKSLGCWLAGTDGRTADPWNPRGLSICLQLYRLQWDHTYGVQLAVQQDTA